MKQYLLTVTALAALPMAAVADPSNIAAFRTYLSSAYDDLAATENDDWDIVDSTIYRDKAAAARAGKNIGPIPLNDLTFVGETRGTIGNAREALIQVLGNDVAKKYPKTAAQAQANFDCWAIHQQSGPHMSHNLPQCKRYFQASLAQLQAGYVPERTARVEQPKPAPTPPHHRELKAVGYEVTFDFDSAELTPAAKALLDNAKGYLEKLERTGEYDVRITGHTDTKGSKAYNEKLSQRRAKKVVEYLGISAKEPEISVRAYGEEQPRVATGDGVKLRANRFASITVMPRDPQVTTRQTY